MKGADFQGYPKWYVKLKLDGHVRTLRWEPKRHRFLYRNSLISFVVIDFTWLRKRRQVMNIYFWYWYLSVILHLKNLRIISPKNLKDQLRRKVSHISTLTSCSIRKAFISLTPITVIYCFNPCLNFIPFGHVDFRNTYTT